MKRVMKKIIAEDEFDNDLSDAVDDVSDAIDDLNDTIDDIEEDEPNIETDNNIADSYIAECDKCGGIFISAMKESDTDIESITGTCPLCEKESTQYLKWIIREVE